MLKNNSNVYTLYYKIKYCACYIMTTLDSLCKQEQRDNRLTGQKVGLAKNPKTPLAELNQGCGCLERTNRLLTSIINCLYKDYEILTEQKVGLAENPKIPQA